MIQDAVSDLISVIVPVFNMQKVLPRCLQSLHNQTYPNLQIILVDDGSTDKSGSICDSWKKNDVRIQVIHEEKKGVSEARNTGLSCVKGPYVSFIDADDYLDWHFYEKMMLAIKREDSDLAVCYAYMCDEDGTPQKNIWHEMAMDTDSGAFLRQAMQDQSWAFSSVWNKLYKRDLIGDTKFVKGNVLEGMLFNAEIGCRLHNAVWLNERLYFHIIHENGEQNPLGRFRIVPSCRTIERAISLIGKKHPDKELLSLLKEDALKEIEQSYIYCRSREWTPEAREIIKIYNRNYDNWHDHVVGVRTKLKLWFMRLMPTIYFVRKIQNID